MPQHSRNAVLSAWRRMWRKRWSRVRRAEEAPRDRRMPHSGTRERKRTNVRCRKGGEAPLAAECTGQGCPDRVGMNIPILGCIPWWGSQRTRRRKAPRPRRRALRWSMLLPHTPQKRTARPPCIPRCHQGTQTRSSRQNSTRWRNRKVLRTGTRETPCRSAARLPSHTGIRQRTDKGRPACP